MGPFYDTIYYLNDWRSQDKLDIQTNEEMKEYYYRLGAYGGILTAILFKGAETTDGGEDEDTDGWVPVEEHSETTDDEWLWNLIFTWNSSLFLLMYIIYSIKWFHYYSLSLPMQC